MSEPGEDDDPRVRSAWRTWLSALAIDAEAAVAAALAYESLAPEGRDAWLDALVEDMDELARTGVPLVALYAPLLMVEVDPPRRARIEAAIAPGGDAALMAITQKPVRALCGEARTGEHVCALVSPLYLDFVALLVCRYRPDKGFLSARREAVRHVVDVLGHRLDPPRGDEASAPELTCTVDGVTVTEAPLRDVIEDLAHAIVADRREGRAPPEALRAFAHLFAPDFGAPPHHFPVPPMPVGGISGNPKPGVA
jgi:hypothetical protein